MLKNFKVPFTKGNETLNEDDVHAIFFTIYLFIRPGDGWHILALTKNENVLIHLI